MDKLEVLWEVPLGVLSYLFSRLVKHTLTLLVQAFNPLKQQARPEWKITDAGFIDSPLKLLWVMSRARWNLHALIAIAGPFSVEHSLSFSLPALNRSAPSWTAVIYTLKGYRTITSTSSLKTSATDDWATISLAPGRYLVGLRHYHWHNPVELPTIQVDGQVALDSQTLAAPRTFNQFYRDLIQRQRWIHQCLNYYVYPLLQYRRWLPAKFVRDTFLPVPNPETQFLFGAMRPDQALAITAADILLAHHDIFLSLYNRTCFPLDWYAVTDPHQVTAPMPEKGIYILRIHPKTPSSPVFNPDWITLTIKSAQ
jgi:hypothetical protein